jgi:hypothetical protein
MTKQALRFNLLIYFYHLFIFHVHENIQKLDFYPFFSLTEEFLFDSRNPYPLTFDTCDWNPDFGPLIFRGREDGLLKLLRRSKSPKRNMVLETVSKTKISGGNLDFRPSGFGP